MSANNNSGGAKALKKRIARLEKLVENMALKGATTAPKPQRKGGARGPKASFTMANPPANFGSIRISRVEMVEAVKADASGAAKGVVFLQPDNFPFLKNLGQSFEKVKWLKVQAYWKPAGSLTTTGLIAIGMDWDAPDNFTAPDREKILVYTPNISCPVREDCQKAPLKIPPARLRSLGWLAPAGAGNPITRRPGALAYNLSSNMAKDALIGEIYISYIVQMAGTKVAE